MLLLYVHTRLFNTMSKDMRMNRDIQARMVVDARVKLLGLTQAEFADYLNDNNDLTSLKFNQSTISKYERGIYKVPAEVMLECQKLQSKTYSITAYSIDRIVEKLSNLNPHKDFDLLKGIDLILDQRMALNPN